MDKKIETKLTKAAKNVKMSYDDFVTTVLVLARENPEVATFLLETMEKNPDCTSSDVLGAYTEKYL